MLRSGEVKRETFRSQRQKVKKSEKSKSQLEVRAAIRAVADLWEPVATSQQVESRGQSGLRAAVDLRFDCSAILRLRVAGY